MKNQGVRKKKMYHAVRKKKCMRLSERKYCTRPQEKWLIGLQKYTCHLKKKKKKLLHKTWDEFLVRTLFKATCAADLESKDTCGFTTNLPMSNTVRAAEDINP